MSTIRIYLLLLGVLFISTVLSQSTHVLFETSYGNIEVVLFDNTPKHRDLFLQVVREGVYTKALFNRVIHDFVNQGGELDEIILDEEAIGLRTKKRLDHEIRTENIHRKGALGAGRDDNPEKASYYSQIYFVIGKVFTEEGLDSLQQKRNIVIPLAHREIYCTEGGTPHLDGNYTIFGQIVKGMDVIEKINKVSTSADDVPLKEVKFSVSILPKRP